MSVNGQKGWLRMQPGFGRSRTVQYNLAAKWFRRMLAVLVLPTAALYAEPAVQVGQVDGRWTADGAELFWTVATARDTIGFRVFRREADGDVQLNEEPVALNVFEPWREVYQLIDPSKALDESAVYRLDAVRPDGSGETLGVWPVQFARPAPVPMKAVRPAAVQAAAASAPLSGPALKIAVRSNDVYRVPFSEIAAGLDWTVAAVSNAVVQTNLAMRCGDRAVAYLADTDSQQIIFYGWPATNRYTHTGFFWIEPGTGLQMARLEPVPVSVSSNLTFLSTVNVEEDHLSLIEHSGTLWEDLYVWDHFPPGTEKSFALPLEGYASNDVSLTVRMIGWYNQSNEATVRVNASSPQTVICFGKVDVSLTYPVAESNLLASGNQIVINGVSSLCVLDGFAVAYERFYAPAIGLLTASDGGHGALGADRFADPLVLNISDPYEPILVADSSGVLPAGWSWPAATNTQWALRERSAIPQTAPQPAGFGSWLREATNQVDYLVIAPRVFEAPAQELADYRAGQGLRTAVALYEDICDQFFGGLNSPEAIRECLTYAHQNWDAAPWMVCLGGGGHSDYLGVLPPYSKNYLPTLLASDSEFLRAADGLLADFSGEDGIPDLAIGRLPVLSTTQFNQYIAKLKAYESNGLQCAHAQMLFVSDVYDPRSGDFYASNLDLAEETSVVYTNSFAVLDSNTPTQVKSELLDAFDSGFGVIHYTGHGYYQGLHSNGQPGGGSILALSDVQGLVNQPVPLFVALTCGSGRFDIYRDQSCLAGELVLNPNGGAMAAYASSGLSFNSSAASLANIFYELHAEGGAGTIGPALVKARQLRGIDPNHPTAYNNYTLLGDPALKLQGGESAGAPFWAPDFETWRWEEFDYAELLDPAVSGSSADSGSMGVNNLAVYALGSDGRGSLKASAGETNELTVAWNQRLYAEDVSYTLLQSTQLVESALWTPVSNAVVRVFAGDDPALERVEADVNLLDSNQYFKLRVQKE